MKKIKLASIFVALFFVSSCSDKDSESYLSEAQAIEECEKWAENGRSMSFERELSYAEKEAAFENKNPKPISIISLETMDVTSGGRPSDRDLLSWFKERDDYTDRTMIVKEESNSRFCKEDEERDQVLGYENQAIKDGSWENVKGKQGEPLIVKHFRY